MSIEGGTWIGATRTESARITSGSKHIAGPETNELQYMISTTYMHTQVPRASTKALMQTAPFSCVELLPVSPQRQMKTTFWIKRQFELESTFINTQKNKTKLKTDLRFR